MVIASGRKAGGSWKVHVAGCDQCREKLALMNAVHDVGDVGM